MVTPLNRRHFLILTPPDSATLPFSDALLSCPQAAMMSRPHDVRPSSNSVVANVICRIDDLFIANKIMQTK
jgi:hypothetical protein